MKELAEQKRIAIIDFARSPFAKSWTELNGVDPISPRHRSPENCSIKTTFDQKQLNILFGER